MNASMKPAEDGLQRRRGAGARQRGIVMMMAIGCMVLIAPRILLLVLLLMTTYLDRAFESILWALAGIIFMPLTTLAYAFAMNQTNNVVGIYLVLVVVAVLLDLGSLTGGGVGVRRRRR